MKLISFKNIEEKRSNPHINPRIPAYDYIISKGYTTKEYFFSFTELKKVGINPNSVHPTTPNGIYCFPSIILDSLTDKEMKNVPYVGDKPYIHILKIRSYKGVIDPLSSYTEHQFNNDMHTIEMFYQRRSKEFSKENFNNIIQQGKNCTKYNNPFAWFWSITERLSADTSLNLGLGWGGVRGGDWVKWYNGEKKKKGEKEHRYGVRASCQGWNNLLRALGYECFVDSEGTGTIHRGEPIQAVFLSNKNFDVVEMIDNKSYRRLKAEDKFKDFINSLRELKVNIVFDSDIKLINQYTKEDIINLFNKCDIDIKNINISKDRININGGIFKSGSVDNIYFDNINFIEGTFEYCKISNSVINNGQFNSGTIKDTTVKKGTFRYGNISNNSVILNASLYDMKVSNSLLKDITSKFSSFSDCNFEGTCKLTSTMIYTEKLSMFLDNPLSYYYDCNIIGIIVNNGIYSKTSFKKCTIKGGKFIECEFNDCVIKDGEFNDCKLFNSKKEGGTFKESGINEIV